ncbi:MAG TPA: UvrD-helicase domain-containing protein, partial [Anaerolineae bacterium]|nr:UvrD-helicase domain-containing protein [Anaerolineae bacterium]
HLLAKMFEQEPVLCNFSAKLAIPYSYAGFLPKLSSEVTAELEKEWGEGRVFGREDLNPQHLADKLFDVPFPYKVRLNEREVRVICAVIKPENRRIDPKTGQSKGVIDRTQEKLVRENLPPRLPQPAPAQETLPLFDDNPVQIPGEVNDLISQLNVRLVRGFAGTGKTDVLIMRARYLQEQHPDFGILVTTFNDPVYQSRLQTELKDIKTIDVVKFTTLCSSIYRKKFGWHDPQKIEGLIARLAQDYPLVNELGQPFLADEFQWMKETNRTQRTVYVDKIRDGRGGSEGRSLSKTVKNQVFDLFELYQSHLERLKAHDWVDIYEKTWECLQSGLNPDKKYDVVLIDEAQHFAPTWVKIIKEFLKPSGTLFICDDPSQSVYRHYSWRQKGIEVVGRTRWLRIPYRNTRQIFEAAYALIDGDPLAQKLLGEAGETVQPDLKHELLRDGPRPQVLQFSSVESERQFIAQTVRDLVEKDGVRPDEIGVLHDETHVVKSYSTMLPRGVNCFETKRQTGLEYRVVFVPEVEKMVDRTLGLDWNEDQSRQRLKFYMTLTRAREQVFLSYRQKWPTLLDQIRPYVDWVQN